LPPGLLIEPSLHAACAGASALNSHSTLPAAIAVGSVMSSAYMPRPPRRSPPTSSVCQPAEVDTGVVVAAPKYTSRVTGIPSAVGMNLKPSFTVRLPRFG